MVHVDMISMLTLILSCPVKHSIDLQYVAIAIVTSKLVTRAIEA